MQDSIQLSDCQNQSMNILVSPQNTKLSKLKFASNTGSQQSLAYSNSTLQKDHSSQRSPQMHNLSSFEKQSKKTGSETRIKKDQRKENYLQSQSIFEKKQFKLTIGGSHRQEPRLLDTNERKTLSKNQSNEFARRNKELEYALQLQTISSQQLRTKVAMMAEIIQNRSQQLGLRKIFQMKNTSKDLKHIDIFVEMKAMRKNMNQKDVIIQKQNSQISKLMKEKQRLNKSIQSYKQRKMLLSTNRKEQYDCLQDEVNDLREEKQALFSYIEQLKGQFETIQQQRKELQQEIQRLQQKQNKMITIERPKLLHQIAQKVKIIQILQQQVMELKMSQNLMEANFEQKIRQMDEIQKKNKQLNVISFVGNDLIITKQDAESQTTVLAEHDIMVAELNLLKSQRDYYLREYRRKIQENAEVYELKLKLNRLTN